MDFINFQSLSNIFGTADQFFIFMVLLALSWYIRRSVTSSQRQKRLEVISTLALEAIHYAEDCEKRGDHEIAYQKLTIAQGISATSSAGAQKLCLAGSWLAEEVHKAGIKRVSIEDAMQWVAAEFHKNVRYPGTTQSVVELTDSAIDLLVQLGRAGYITLPANALQAASLAYAIADWVVTNTDEATGDLAEKRTNAIARFQSTSLVGVEPTGESNDATTSVATEAVAAEEVTADVVTDVAIETVATETVTTDARLTTLVKQALEYVAELRRKGRLRMSERDTAMAWIIQQAQENEIPVTRDQISAAILLAF